MRLALRVGVMLLIIGSMTLVEAQHVASPSPSASAEAMTSSQGTPQRISLVLSPHPPTANQSKLQLLESTRHNLRGPSVPSSKGATTLPTAVSAARLSTVRATQAQKEAPGNFVLFNDAVMYANVFQSNLNEPSVANNGNTVFYTGNWYAGYSTDSGATWSYADPWVDMDEFCCQQDVIYDPSRQVFFWNRLGFADTGTNRFRLGVSSDGVNWWFYDTLPSSTNSSWTNQRWDHPYLALSNNYLWIANNLFNENDIWTRSVILRWPLDALKNGAAFSYGYYSSDESFNFTPVQGATDTMYWASHLTTSELRIWAWRESSGAVFSYDRTIDTWVEGTMSCPSPDGGDACALLDNRISSGWRASGVIGFLWNAAADGVTFLYPHVDSALFDEATLQYNNRWPIWTNDVAWLCATASSNSIGQLGLAISSSGGGTYPRLWLGIEDEFTPPWTLYLIAESTSGPLDNAWGDYLRVRPFIIQQSAANVWIASGYTLQSGGVSQSLEPHYYVFGNDGNSPFTSITLTSSSDSPLLGSFVSLSGAITPSTGSVRVTLILSHDRSSWTSFMSAMTDSSGSYSLDWAPPYPGGYLIQAMWSGDTQHVDSTSPPITLTVTGTAGPEARLLLTSPGTATKRQTVNIAITLFNPADTNVAFQVAIQIVGPNSYIYFDTAQIIVLASSSATLDLTWVAPNQTGAYSITVGLLPPQPAAFGAAIIQVT